MADLMRSITIPAKIDFMAVSSYGNEVNTSGVVKIIKDLDIDLNGYDFICVEGESSIGHKAIQLHEGSTINIYSSRKGGRIFHAIPYIKGADSSSYTDYQVHSQNGFITIPESVDAAYATIGAFRGFDANPEYNGGCLAYAQGYDFTSASTTVERGHFVGGASRVLNINGGQYYFFARPPYAAIATTALTVYSTITVHLPALTPPVSVSISLLPTPLITARSSVLTLTARA